MILNEFNYEIDFNFLYFNYTIVSTDIEKKFAEFPIIKFDYHNQQYVTNM